MSKQRKKFIRQERNKRAITMAFAYVGVLTGAGLASGQELMQYFIGFGKAGLIAVVVVGILHALFGVMVLSMGSFFLAKEHSKVLDEITHPIIVKILDWGLIITCFVLGFVMIAGAGSNLNQQFGLQSWIGSLICVVLILVVSQFDFDKVSQIIAAFTPLIVGFIVIAAVYTFFKGDLNIELSNNIALRQKTAVSNVVISSINYFAMCLISGASMAFVLGGEEFNSQVAKKSGLLGGAITGIITALAAFTLYLNLDLVEGSDLPMQIVIQNIHPILGLFMSIVIYGMIFNTGISLYYALARRVAGYNKKKFNISLFILVMVGFALSFVGFKKLVGIMYPIIGYIGIVFMIVILYWWIKEHKSVKDEGEIRRRIFKLTFARRDENQDFSKKDSMELKSLKKSSVAEVEEINETLNPLVEDQVEEFNNQ